MNSSDESPLWQEVKRLREQLDHANERHTAALASIRERISELESKLRESTTDDVKPADVPPPLPRADLPEEGRKAVPFTPKASKPITTKPVSVPTSEPEPAEDRSFELDFGKVWFVRIGIVILLTGLVFLGNYAYQNWIREMPNGVRLAALYACALGLVETGRRLAAKEQLNRFGEVLLAGGMAFFYYCTFAAHHVGRLKVIDSPVLAAVLLFGAAGAIAAVSWLRQAKATAILGIVLASYSTMLQPIGWMSCVSNILLGGLGLFFMLRPGWAAPGWISMLGSYGAFFGWQLLGAIGNNARTDDPATLWFLPPLWVMFAMPGVLGRFRESLSDRARAWFTGVNNALFFLLFSGVWITRNGDEAYWKVAAVFGLVLIALGILDRRQSTTAGGVNIAQGLAVATFALVLKLDGHHLALVLAFESLALAMAAWKYRGKSEVVFALLAGLGAALLTTPPDTSIPIWSTAIVAALIAIASVVTVRINAEEKEFALFNRFSAALLFIAATMVATHLCFFRLGESPAILTAILLSGLLSLAFLKFDTKRLQPEIILASLWFLGVACFQEIHRGETLAAGIAVVVSVATCWLWHRQPESGPTEIRVDLAIIPPFPAWLFSLATPFLLWRISAAVGDGFEDAFLTNHLASFGLMAVAVLIRCKRLVVSSAILAFLTLGLLLVPGSLGAGPLYTAAALSIAAAVLLLTPWAKSRITDQFSQPSHVIFRATAFIAYCAAWYLYAPDTWSDWLALTSIALTLATLFLKRQLLLESVALVSVAVVGLAIATATSPWQLSPEQEGWRGFTVVLALLLLVLTYRQRPALIADPEARARAIAGIAGLTCAVTTIWATQMLVWRFGWRPSAVLWTVLGFAFVSAGLWQRLHILRVCGFLLLILSLAKLFVSDVWDFTTFMRVVSFIVLGLALILLGLFYNKFADAIKALLEDEKRRSSTPAKEEG